LGAATEACAINEQQLEWTKVGNSSWSRHNQGAAAEASEVSEILCN